MCCAKCSAYACRSALVLRVHSAAHLLMPSPHYHLCRPGEACTFDCRRCGKLVSETPRPPKSHFQLGCCHRCEQYKTCIDASGQHVQQLQVQPKPALTGAEGVTVSP